MGNGRVAAAFFAALGLLGGCGGEPAAAGSRDDVLVLEIGGEQQSLRAALVSLGRTVDAPRRLRPAPPPPPSGGEGGRAGRVPPPSQDPPPGPSQGRSLDPAQDPGQRPEPPAPDPEPLSEWVVVELQDGETISHVAGRMLGTSRRFADIMEWNGWDEGDVRRLKVGQKIRLKRSELR